MARIALIDPNSYNNLSLYDAGVLKCVPEEDEVVFFGSRLWDLDPVAGVRMSLPFDYNLKGNPLSKFLAYTSNLRRLKGEIQAFNPDLVHIEWIRVKDLDTDLRFLKWLQRRGMKVVHTAHNVLPHNTGMKYKRFYGRYYHQVDHLIVHARKSKEQMVGLFGLDPGKISVIPHGMLSFDSVAPAVEARKRELREELGLEGKTVLASMGAQMPYKGTDWLVRAWAENSELRDNPELRLFLVGKNSGIDFSPLEGIGNVTVVDGKVPGVEFQAYFQLADLAMMPYREISQSGVLFSAIGAGVPVMVTDVGGLPEALEVAPIGWNIGEARYENVRDFLLRCASNPEMLKRRKADAEAFAKVRAHYDWGAISDQTFRLYHRLLE